MAHDPARVADTKAWLEKAAGDIKAAEILSSESPLHGAAVFHCQQAAEKAMKGFLAWHDVPFRKTHDLEEIGETCVAIDSKLKGIVGRAIRNTLGSFDIPVSLGVPRNNRWKLRLRWHARSMMPLPRACQTM